MFGWLDKARTVRANRKKFLPHGAETAGEAAEDAVFERLEKIVKKSGHKNTWRVWSGVRIRDKGWRSEIDLLIATEDRLYLLELKNWSGELDMNGNTLVQIRRHQGGIVEHGDLMKTMRKREAAVRAWLTKHRSEVPPIERCVLFYNPRLHMTPAVFDYFGDEVASASEWTSHFARNAKHAQNTSPMTAEERRKLHDTIEMLSTWDTVTMHGGRRIHGDIRSSETIVTLENGAELRLHNRRRIASIDVQVPRSYLNAIFGDPNTLRVVLNMRDGTTVSADAPIDAQMRVHAAGQRKTELVPLRHFTHMSFGGTR